jgi:tetratricopeptide (TPR) repeat protein
MLFDLKSGRRRRVVQIVFGFLAFIFFISFVGFGIGSGASGGLFDAIGLGGDDSGDSGDLSSQYDPQIEQAEKQLQQDPKDANALVDLARFRYLAGTTQLDVDEETQLATLTDETSNEWNLALDAWEKYVKTDPKDVDPQVAAQMICAYVPLLPPPQCVGAQTDDIDFGGAVETQKLLVADDPSAPNYVNLAYLLYNDGQLDAARDAADQAIAKAPPKEKERFEKAFDKLDKQASQIKKAQEKAGEAGGATGESQLQNPFGSLGSGSSTGLPPSTP